MFYSFVNTKKNINCLQKQNNETNLYIPIQKSPQSNVTLPPLTRAFAESKKINVISKSAKKPLGIDSIEYNVEIVFTAENRKYCAPSVDLLLITTVENFLENITFVESNSGRCANTEYRRYINAN